MSFSILSALQSQLGVKIENLTTGRVEFIRFDALTTEISLQAEIHKHRLDNGQTIIDGRTRQPFTITLAGFCQTFKDFETARNILKSREHYYRITVNGRSWDNVLSNELATDQSAEAMSVSPVQFGFTQALVRQFGYVKTDASADAPNRVVGDVIPKDSTITLGQLWENIMKKI